MRPFVTLFTAVTVTFSLSLIAAAEGVVGGAKFIPIDRPAVKDAPPAATATPQEPVPFAPPAAARLVTRDSGVKTAGHESVLGEPDYVTLVAAEQAPPATATDQSTPLKFSKQLIALEVKLARRIIERPDNWKFEDVKSDAAELLKIAASDNQKQTVEELLARTERFAAIADRRRQLAQRGTAPAIAPITPITPAPQQTPPTRVAVAPIAPATSVASVPPVVSAPPVAPANPVTPQYDAIGELRPVVSKRPGAPKYALVDAGGKVVTFVTPSPGLDLDPLLGKQVGARGGRGFMPEYGRRHLTAQNVTRLEANAPLRR